MATSMSGKDVRAMFPPTRLLGSANDRENLPDVLKMFATLHLQASGLVKTELGDIVSGCRHSLIEMAIFACSSFRPQLLAGQKRLRGDPS
jgi:hypothetical protein